MPTVTFYTIPSDKGSITFNSDTYTNGQSHVYPEGVYNALANVPFGYEFDKWTATGGVVCEMESENPTPVTVEDNGTLTAHFRYIPPEYTQAVANLKAFRTKVLTDLVGSRLVAGLNAGHDSMTKYKGLVESLSIVPYAFARVRESALALRLKGLDIGGGELSKIVAGYEGGEGTYPMNPPFAVPQRKLPQVDVFMYQTIKDIDLLKETDLSGLKSFLLLQCSSDTFYESPDAENSFYDYYMMYPQRRSNEQVTLLNKLSGFEDWDTVKGVATFVRRDLTPSKETAFVTYRLYVLLDSVVYGAGVIQETPPVLALQSAPAGVRPTITMNIAGQGILSTTEGAFAIPRTVEKPLIVGFQQVAQGYSIAVTEELWRNDFTLTISVSPSGGGTTNPSVGDHMYLALTDVVVTASPSGGYSFDHWEIDGVDKGSANPITVTMVKDYALKAVFVPT